MYTVTGAVTLLCRRRVMTTLHSGRTTSSHDHHGLSPVTPVYTQTVTPTRTRTGPGRRRRLNAAAQISCDSLASIGHLRTGQYYRWSPDISHIPASYSSVNTATVLCKSPTDVAASADSAASRPWQQRVADSTTASHDMSPVSPV